MFESLVELLDAGILGQSVRNELTTAPKIHKAERPDRGVPQP